MNDNGSRYAALQDTMTPEEREIVTWMGTMGYTMQAGWSYVMLSRKIDQKIDQVYAVLSMEIAALRRPAWRTGLDRLGYVIGVALAALLGAQTK